jgi:hypothetical protein
MLSQATPPILLLPSADMSLWDPSRRVCGVAQHGARQLELVVHGGPGKGWGHKGMAGACRIITDLNVGCMESYSMACESGWFHAFSLHLAAWILPQLI